MTEIILFGGTSEARTLCELFTRKRIAALVCVATEYGEALLESTDTLRVNTGRLDKTAMEILLHTERPHLVIDATHPYACKVSDNIRAACEAANVKRLRILREASGNDGCVTFSDMDALIKWLNRQSGTVFSALGAKEAVALTAVEDYKERVWLRILPDTSSLSACLDAGFPAKHIICMQGPFSQELNAAMFRSAGAEILLTKESGAAGGFTEKLEAAQDCGMRLAVLSRPGETSGVTLDAVIRLIEGGSL